MGRRRLVRGRHSYLILVEAVETKEKHEEFRKRTRGKTQGITQGKPRVYVYEQFHRPERGGLPEDNGPVQPSACPAIHRLHWFKCWREDPRCWLWNRQHDG